jgi:two-component system phosphate regulon sensor histidine kinase PhoR
MKLRFRWKLMTSYVGLVLLMGGVVYAYLHHTLETYITAEMGNNLLNEARLARLVALDRGGIDQRDAPAMAATIGAEIKARVTLIAADGTVIGDSDVAPERLATLENHLHRPEVQEALANGSGTSLRYSETLRTPMLYAALRLGEKGDRPAFLRLALPLTVLAQTSARLQATLVAAVLLALLLSLVLSYLLSRLVSRTLRLMAESAARIGAGEFDRRLPVVGRDELGELARVMNDMTARVGSQVERLSSEKNRLDAILAGMGEGLMVTDAEGRVALVNPAFSALFPLEGAVEGKALVAITRHPDLHEAFRRVMATGEEQSTEITLGFPEERTLATHWVPLRDAADIRGVVAVFHDISDIRRLEQVRRDFVANVSHELRTPVTVIKGYAEALASGQTASDPEKAARFAGVIEQHADRLGRLIADLLSLSELESGGLTLSLAPVVPVAAVGHAVTLLEGKARAKGIVVDWEGVGGAPPVLADPGRLEQVLVNLLDNAITYTPAGGTIRFGASTEGETVALSVADTGIGIPARDLPRIFERFYRVDAARSREQGGTGLGLAIVKHILLLLRGNVTVESTPGKGSVFTVTLRKA